MISEVVSLYSRYNQVIVIVYQQILVYLPLKTYCLLMRRSCISTYVELYFTFSVFLIYTAKFVRSKVA